MQTPVDTLLTLSENLEVHPCEYTVTFTNVKPTAELAQKAVNTLEIFALVDSPFHLIADMRTGQLISQLRHLLIYKQLIGKIANENCKHCHVLLPYYDGNPLAMVLIPAIRGIVQMLGVPCTITQCQKVAS
jgi:hypothetical protein